jgi:hypothetical protein
MDSTWTRILVAVVVIVAAVVVAKKFLPLHQKTGPKPQKTYQDVIAEDDKRLRSEPGAEYSTVQEISGQMQQVGQQPAQRAEAAEANEPAKQAEKEPVYKELSIEEQVDAERLLEMAITERKMARLPAMGYKRMVDYCREIISRYPESIYAAKARRILGEVPEQYWERYGITQEEITPSK